MTHAELHQRLRELLYIEDPAMYDIILASMVANIFKISDPVWLTLIGTSSGGKSQIIRPLATTSPLVHRIDDLTSNSLLSGMGNTDDTFLNGIGEHGILSMDDLTVLFSKNTEQRAEILGQFRMLYDGRFSKITGGHAGEMEWQGYLGMISASTPRIYKFFGEVADMGERFVNYRMKPLDRTKALDFINNHSYSAQELDVAIGEVFQEFFMTLGETNPKENKPELFELSDEVVSDLSDAAEWFCLLRTPVHVDDRSGMVDEFPEPEMPLRVMKQLVVLAKALQVVYDRPLTTSDLDAVLWVGYSLCNDKRRAYLKAAIALEREGKFITRRNLSAMTGLHTEIIEKGMSALQALGVVDQTEDTPGTPHKYTLQHHTLTKLVVRLDPPPKTTIELDLE